MTLYIDIPYFVILQCKINIMFVLLFAGELKPNSRHKRWKDITEGDFQIFLGLLITMGIVRKNSIGNYWSRNELIHTPFFPKKMSRNRFQLILCNLHMNDNQKQIAKGRPGYDPLYKLRPLLDTLERTFLFNYKPVKEISVDEAGCPFKGRVSFKCYNPNKPNRFSIKIFQVCEAVSGYCVKATVYTGKGTHKNPLAHKSDATLTTNLVLRLLHEAKLLDKGHHVYMDNYYNSPELAEELANRGTYMCGTVRKNRKELPLAVSSAKFKKPTKKTLAAITPDNPKVEQVCWRRKDKMLAIKWMDKRPVYVLSTIHKALMVKSKTDYKGTPMLKPVAVHDYSKYMMGVDLADQIMQYYTFLRRSIKWWRKLTIHYINLALMNAYILYRKFGDPKLTHEQFRLSVANSLFEQGRLTTTAATPIVRPEREQSLERLTARHFPSVVPAKMHAVKKIPYRECVVCRARSRGYKKHRAWSKYWCKECGVVLCAECFQDYHTLEDWKKQMARKAQTPSSSDTDSSGTDSATDPNSDDQDQNDDTLTHDNVDDLMT